MRERDLPRRLAAYVEGLELSGGDHDGRAFELLPWERRFLRGAFGRAGDAGLTIARGNGKSALVAAIATAVVDPAGPMHGRRREVVCVASSFQQARVVFEDVREFLRAACGLPARSDSVWRVQDDAAHATVEHRPSGARARCIGSDPARAHGLRPFLALCDEPAQWERARADRMYAAVRTGLGKVPSSKLVALGTRPAASEHWFSTLLRSPRAYSQIHAASPEDPPFRVRTWRKANPSLDHLPSLAAQLRTEAEDAKRDPAALASFKALRLNLGTADTARAVLIGAETWRRIEGEADTAGPCAWGVDLGGSAAMSAIVGFWPLTGALRALAAFADTPDLATRGLADGVGGLYVAMERRAELRLHPGRTVRVSALLREAMAEWGRPAAVCADRWRKDELIDALREADVPAAFLSLRGQGFKDGGEDVRAFRKACLDGRVTPAASLLMRAAMAEAVTVPDPAGNEKLAKGSEGTRRARARDDAAAAAILAVAEGCRRESGGQRKPRRPRLVVAG